MGRCKISKWELVRGAPDRVNIPCLMHDTLPCQVDVKFTSNELIRIFSRIFLKNIKQEHKATKYV